MTKLAFIPAIAVAGLISLTSPAAAFEQKQTERVDRTVSIRSGGQLRLKNFSGKVVITGGTRGDISVHAVRRADRDRLDHIKLEIVETGSGVTIEANKKDSDWHERDNNVVETDFDIQVPDDVTLDGQERNCLASTRKGTPCQREPLPGMDYCPSHKHLEETFETREVEAAAA